MPLSILPSFKDVMRAPRCGARRSTEFPELSSITDIRCTEDCQHHASLLPDPRQVNRQGQRAPYPVSDSDTHPIESGRPPLPLQPSSGSFPGEGQSLREQRRMWAGAGDRKRLSRTGLPRAMIAWCLMEWAPKGHIQPATASAGTRFRSTRGRPGYDKEEAQCVSSARTS